MGQAIEYMIRAQAVQHQRHACDEDALMAHNANAMCFHPLLSFCVQVADRESKILAYRLGKCRLEDAMMV
jgi:hypothetical protein